MVQGNPGRLHRGGDTWVKLAWGSAGRHGAVGRACRAVGVAGARVRGDSTPASLGAAGGWRGQDTESRAEGAGPE